MTLAVALAASVAGVGFVAAQADPAHGGAPASVKVMEWNACGNNSACKYYEDPDGLVATMRWHMLNHGRAADAAIFEETCGSFAKKLEHDLESHTGKGWDVRFAPIKLKRTSDPSTSPAKKCVRDRGQYGTMIALPDENTWWDTKYLPSPDGKEWRVAMCATVPSWNVKLCNAHFTSPGEDPDGKFRPQQVKAYQDFVAPSRFQVLFGGDLNLASPVESGNASGGVNPLYDSFVECAQKDASAPRSGPGTYYQTNPHDNAHTSKIDYLFTDRGVTHGCGTPGGTVESSDHRPIWMTADLKG
jgi:endonuclease/exonuclease/phosphatase family metal-dependent hydrolase